MFKMTDDEMKLYNTDTDAVSAEIVRNKRKWDILFKMHDTRRVFSSFETKNEALYRMHELCGFCNDIFKIIFTEV